MYSGLLLEWNMLCVLVSAFDYSTCNEPTPWSSLSWEANSHSPSQLSHFLSNVKVHYISHKISILSQHTPLKCQSTPMNLHCAISHKAVIFILTAVRTWNLTDESSLYPSNVSTIHFNIVPMPRSYKWFLTFRFLAKIVCILILPMYFLAVYFRMLS
jgi:hypothetical protein